jgi:FkbM family methyltransferase
VKRLLQSGLLGAYKAAHASGFLRTRAGRALYEKCYEVYKSRLEAAQIERLREHVVPGTWVIDVGANIGFFSVRFGRWVSAGGRVIAVEAEAENVARLRVRLANEKLDTVVEAIHAFVSDEPGEVRLELNPVHPADHKLSIDGGGVTVSAVTLDGLLEARRWPRVSLVKIDVQGAEPRVLAGARRLLQEQKPALFVEFDPSRLERLGSSVSTLFTQVEEAGYLVHSFDRDGIGPALGRAEVLARTATYADYLLLPRNPA